MKYAVLRLSGSSIRVEEGQVIKVDRVDNVKPKVLLFRDDEKVLIGNPYLDENLVKTELVGESRGKKITVRRFKAKSRYHKTKGYRSLQSLVKVVSLGDAVQAPKPSIKKKMVKVQKKDGKEGKKVVAKKSVRRSHGS